jgi:hypothetical protein
MTYLVDTAAAMEDDLRCISVVSAGCSDLPCGPDRYVNAPAWLVNEPIKFSGTVVAQRRARPSTQDSSPEHRHAGRLACEGGIHAPVERLPSAVVQLRVDQARVEPGFGRLPAGYDAVLEVEQVLA